MKIVNGEEALSYEDYIEVDEVRELLKSICGKAIVKQGATDYVLYGNELVKFIESKSGFALNVEGGKHE